MLIFVIFLILQSKEEMINIRLRETEANASVAELRHRISELEIQVRESVTKVKHTLYPTSRLDLMSLYI